MAPYLHASRALLLQLCSQIQWPDHYCHLICCPGSLQILQVAFASSFIRSESRPCTCADRSPLAAIAIIIRSLTGKEVA